MRRLALLAALALLGTAGPGVLAQQDDERTDDHRRRDEAYYERLKQHLEERKALDIREGETEIDARARQFYETAEELIRDGSYRSTVAHGYRVQSDDPRLDLDEVARVLGGFRDFFEEFWNGRLELKPYAGDARVFLFYSFYKYNQLLEGDWRRSTLRPAGHYGSIFDALVLHSDSGPIDGIADTLVHEAAHQLVDQRIYGGDGSPSIWIAEGMATYFGYTYMDSEGRFVPGVAGGKVAALAFDRKPKASEAARRRLRDFDKRLEDDAAGLVRQVVEATDPASFYGGSVLDRYTASWVLVHYLFHGDEGRHAEAFARYLTLEAAGKGGPAVFYATLGMTAEELDAAVIAYLPTIRVR